MVSAAHFQKLAICTVCQYHAHLHALTFKSSDFFSCGYSTRAFLERQRFFLFNCCCSGANKEKSASGKPALFMTQTCEFAQRKHAKTTKSTQKCACKRLIQENCIKIVRIMNWRSKWRRTIIKTYSCNTQLTPISDECTLIGAKQPDILQRRMFNEKVPHKGRVTGFSFSNVTVPVDRKHRRWRKWMVDWGNMGRRDVDIFGGQAAPVQQKNRLLRNWNARTIAVFVWQLEIYWYQWWWSTGCPA